MGAVLTEHDKMTFIQKTFYDDAFSTLDKLDIFCVKHGEYLINAEQRKMQHPVVLFNRAE